MGCGAALIDFELAKHIEKISCIDISQTVIDHVEQQIKEKRIDNMRAICMDGLEVKGQWETVMAIFHGGDKVFSHYFHLAKDQLILVTHGSMRGGFGPEGKKAIRCFGTPGVCANLDSLGVKYHLCEFELEYGQPFTDLKDAEEFVKAYTMPMTQRELDSYLEERLVSTEDQRFPLYLPKKKDIGLFVIRRSENEKF